MKIYNKYIPIIISVFVFFYNTNHLHIFISSYKYWDKKKHLQNHLRPIFAPNNIPWLSKTKQIFLIDIVL